MTFAWPQALLALALIPLGFLVLRAVDRGGGGRSPRSRVASRSGRRRLAAGSMPSAARPSSRREPGGPLPGALILAGLVVMVVALARPQGTIDVPRQEGTVILAFDISASMGATDLAADPDGRRGRGRDRLRPAPAGQRRHRCRRLQRFRASPSSSRPTTRTRSSPRSTGCVRSAGRRSARGIDASLAAIAQAAAGPTVDYYTQPLARADRARPTPVPPGRMPRPSSCS